jgi:microcystin-dependent protein
LILDGSTVTNGQSLYPILWAIIPAGWKSGANIVLPDARGRTTIGAGTGSGLTARTLGNTGGTETHVLTPGETAVKGHSHTFTGSSVTSGAGSAHTHTQNSHEHPMVVGWGAGSGSYPNWDGTSNKLIYGLGTSGSAGVTATNNNESAHTHSVTAAGTVSTLADGANGSAHNNMQPWLALNKIIRCS